MRMQNNNERKRLEEKTGQFAGEIGLDVIEFKVIPHGTSITVRGIVDYPRGGVTMGECSRLNRLIRDYMESTGTWGDDFSVEIDSPGLKRPLKDKNDFLRL